MISLGAGAAEECRSRRELRSKVSTMGALASASATGGTMFAIVILWSSTVRQKVVRSKFFMM